MYPPISGRPTETNKLGQLYLGVRGVEPNFAKALALSRQAAGWGQAGAMRQVGYIYLGNHSRAGSDEHTAMS